MKVEDKSESDAEVRIFAYLLINQIIFKKFTYHHTEKLMFYLMHLIIFHTELFPMCCSYGKTGGSNDWIPSSRILSGQAEVVFLSFDTWTMRRRMDCTVVALNVEILIFS